MYGKFGIGNGFKNWNQISTSVGYYLIGSIFLRQPESLNQQIVHTVKDGQEWQSLKTKKTPQTWCYAEFDYLGIVVELDMYCLP
jgi:hypothetical protein